MQSITLTQSRYAYFEQCCAIVSKTFPATIIDCILTIESNHNLVSVFPAFHTKCVDPWLTNNKRTCPVCKRKVVPRGEHDSSDSDTSDDDSDAPTESTPLLNSASGGGGAGGGGGSNEQSPQSSRSATPTRHVDASTAMTPAEDTDEESGGSASTDSYEMGSNQATVAIIGPSGSIQQMRPVTEIQIEHEVLVERPDESSDDEVLMIDNADEDGFVCDDENARLQKV